MNKKHSISIKLMVLSLQLLELDAKHILPYFNENPRN